MYIYIYVCHKTGIYRNPHTSSNWNFLITRQLGDKHTFCQNLLSTKKKSFSYFRKNITCLNLGPLKTYDFLLFPVTRCIGGLRQIAVLSERPYKYHYFSTPPYSQDKHVLNKAVEIRVSTQRGEEFLGSGGLSPASCRGRPGSILNSPYGIWGRHTGTSTSSSPRTFVYWCDSSFHQRLILHPLCQHTPTVLIRAASLKWQLNVRQFTEQTWEQ